MSWRLNTKENPLYVKQVGTTDGDGNGQASKYEQLTNLTSAISLTPPAGATVATIIPEGAPVRMRRDGIDPTITVGMPVGLGVGIKLYGPEISATRFIGQSPGAVLNVEYEG